MIFLVYFYVCDWILINIESNILHLSNFLIFINSRKPLQVVCYLPIAVFVYASSVTMCTLPVVNNFGLSRGHSFHQIKTVVNTLHVTCLTWHCSPLASHVIMWSLSVKNICFWAMYKNNLVDRFKAAFSTLECWNNISVCLDDKQAKFIRDISRSQFGI